MAAPGTFWARRKAAVQAEDLAEAAAARAAREAAEADAILAEQANKSDDQLLQELGLPNPDMLVQGDDFAAFMGRAVPEHLRRRALRKLWVSNPVLANLDGLVDHGEDYTDAATVIPGMKSAYQVGKGMMQHVIALAEAHAETEAVARPSDTGAPPFAEPAPQNEVVLAEAEETSVEDVPAKPAASADQTDEAPRPRRHMRFEFSS